MRLELLGLLIFLGLSGAAAQNPSSSVEDLKRLHALAIQAVTTGHPLTERAASELNQKASAYFRDSKTDLTLAEVLAIVEREYDRLGVPDVLVTVDAVGGKCDVSYAPVIDPTATLQLGLTKIDKKPLRPRYYDFTCVCTGSTQKITRRLDGDKNIVFTFSCANPVDARKARDKQ